MQRRKLRFGVFRDVFHAGNPCRDERIRRGPTDIRGERRVHSGPHAQNVPNYYTPSRFFDRMTPTTQHTMFVAVIQCRRPKP